MQKRQVKVLFLTPGSDFSFVADPVFGAAAVSSDQEVRVSKALSSEFKTIKEVRNALASGKMYTHPRLFDLFCSGLESGKLIEVYRIHGDDPHFRYHYSCP
jgi:hypothetical protein